MTITAVKSCRSILSCLCIIYPIYYAIHKVQSLYPRVYNVGYMCIEATVESLLHEIKGEESIERRDARPPLSKS